MPSRGTRTEVPGPRSCVKAAIIIKHISTLSSPSPMRSSPRRNGAGKRCPGGRPSRPRVFRGKPRDEPRYECRSVIPGDVAVWYPIPLRHDRLLLLAPTGEADRTVLVLAAVAGTARGPVEFVHAPAAGSRGPSLLTSALSAGRWRAPPHRRRPALSQSASRFTERSETSTCRAGGNSDLRRRSARDALLETCSAAQRGAAIGLCEGSCARNKCEEPVQRRR